MNRRGMRTHIFLPLAGKFRRELFPWELKQLWKVRRFYYLLLVKKKQMPLHDFWTEKFLNNFLHPFCIHIKMLQLLQIKTHFRKFSNETVIIKPWFKLE